MRQPWPNKADADVENSIRERKRGTSRPQGLSISGISGAMENVSHCTDTEVKKRRSKVKRPTGNCHGNTFKDFLNNVEIDADLICL